MDARTLILPSLYFSWVESEWDRKQSQSGLVVPCALERRQYKSIIRRFAEPDSRGIKQTFSSVVKFKTLTNKNGVQLLIYDCKHAYDEKYSLCYTYIYMIMCLKWNNRR